MTKDFADFLASLNREGVAYVVIGGIAVMAHLPYRTTRDLDDGGRRRAPAAVTAAVRGRAV